MRVSTRKDDPGYAINVYNLKISLNGVEVKQAVLADEELGYIDIVKIVDGRAQVDENDEIVTERVFGEVKVIVPEGWTPISCTEPV